MASNMALTTNPTASLKLHISQSRRRKKHAVSIKVELEEKKPSLSRRAAQSEQVTDDEQIEPGSRIRAQLDRLEQITSSTNINHGYEIDGDTIKPTIREQLTELTRGRKGDFSLPLPLEQKKKEGSKNLTVSQRRNVKRRVYLAKVARRNDAAFFALIGAFVILPPVVILAVAAQTGYVQLFP